MSVVRNQHGFEYRADDVDRRTIFETFLAYTDEKERSSVVLGEILRQHVVDSELRILDVGAGTGEYLELAIATMPSSVRLRLCLIEPSGSLVGRLRRTWRRSPGVNTRVIKDKFEDVNLDELFDVVLASHVFYHFPMDSWAVQLKKMLDMVKPNGIAVIVVREKDEVYEFKNTFRPRIMKRAYSATHAEDILLALETSSIDVPYEVERRTVTSHLTLPSSSANADLRDIIEFYLHAPWETISQPLQLEIVDFLKSHKWMLEQQDGLIIIRRLAA